MDRRLTIGLLVILLALGGYIWYNFWRADAPPLTPTTPEPTPIVFLELKEDDIQAVSLAGGDGKTAVRVQRAGDKWNLVQPAQGPADSDRVNELLFQVSSITADRQLPPSTDLAGFGLKPPAAEVTVEMKDGSKPTLQVGRKNPDNTSYYMLKSGDTNLYLVRAAVGDAILDLLKSPPFTPTPTATSTVTPPAGTPVTSTPATGAPSTVTTATGVPASNAPSASTPAASTTPATSAAP